jgi:hypothetical protein
VRHQAHVFDRLFHGSTLEDDVFQERQHRRAKISDRAGRLTGDSQSPTRILFTPVLARAFWSVPASSARWLEKRRWRAKGDVFGIRHMSATTRKPKVQSSDKRPTLSSPLYVSNLARDLSGYVKAVGAQPSTSKERHQEWWWYRDGYVNTYRRRGT